MENRRAPSDLTATRRGRCMNPFSRGLFAAECRRQEKQIVADFRRQFLWVVGSVSAVAVLLHFA